MAETDRLQIMAEPTQPLVVAEDVAVYVEVNGAGFRLSADDAHALSELLMSASLAVERRIMEAERSRRG